MVVDWLLARWWVLVVSVVFAVLAGAGWLYTRQQQDRWKALRAQGLRYGLPQFDALHRTRFEDVVRDLMQRDGCQDARRGYGGDRHERPGDRAGGDVRRAAAAARRRPTEPGRMGVRLAPVVGAAAGGAAATSPDLTEPSRTTGPEARPWHLSGPLPCPEESAGCPCQQLGNPRGRSAGRTLRASGGALVTLREAPAGRGDPFGSVTVAWGQGVLAVCRAVRGAWRRPKEAGVHRVGAHSEAAVVQPRPCRRGRCPRECHTAP